MSEEWAALSARVERAIGEPIPDSADISTPEWRRLLGRLGDTDPTLRSEVLDALTHSDLRLPAEEEAAADHARERVRGSLFNRFLRPDGLRTGAKRFNLRKTLNYVGVTAGIAIFAWSVIPKTPRTAAPAQPAAATTQSQVATPQAAAPPQVAAALVPPGASTALPSGTTASPLGTAGIPTAPIPPADVGSVPIPPIPDGSVPPPGPALNPSGGSANGLILYEASRQNKSVVAYQQQRPEGESRADQVVVYAPTSAAQAAIPDAAATTTAQTSGVVVYQQQAAPAAAAPGGENNTAAVTLPRRGSIITVKLVNPIAVAQSWPSAPVLAEVVKGGPEGAVLFGQATLANTGVIAISFTAVLLPDGKELPLNAAAYDPAVGRLGIGGAVSTMMPGTVAATMQAGLSAVSDYAQRLAQQQQVTITNGFITITQGTPNFWASLGASLARAFTPPGGSTSGPVVVTRIDKGAVIAAMVL